jgi:hypothetical protein
MHKFCKTIYWATFWAIFFHKLTWSPYLGLTLFQLCNEATKVAQVTFHITFDILGRVFFALASHPRINPHMSNRHEAMPLCHSISRQEQSDSKRMMQAAIIP